MAEDDRIIFALDVGDLDCARRWVETLKGSVAWFKVGLELFTAVGPSIVRLLKDNGIRCFLDLKLHDIPNTVAGAVRSVTRLGADMTTVHLSGGRAMVEAARDAAHEEADREGIAAPKIIGVSVLTSMGREDLLEIGIHREPSGQVSLLADLAVSCGIDGLVCSASDLPVVKKNVPPSLVLVTPGIRPEGVSAMDQKRIATPRYAIDAGAHFLVIGRPISAAQDPAAAVRMIARQMASASRPSG